MTSNPNKEPNTLLPEPVFTSLSRALSEQGIEPQWETLRRFEKQGYMNKTLTVQKNGSNLIITYAPEPFLEQRRQNMPHKLVALSTYVRQHWNSYRTQTYYWGEVFEDGSYITVKNFIPGVPLGHSDINANTIEDVYDVAEQETHYWQRTVDVCAASIHQLPAQGFGFLQPSEELGVVGEAESWEAFLLDGTRRWVGMLREDQTLGENERAIVQEIQSQLPSILDHYFSNYPLRHGAFVHGDIMNPSNVLIHEKSIVGLIDFEWAMVGDPAMEYARSQQLPTDAYFSSLPEGPDKVTPEEFLKRAEYCRLFWSLWAAYVFFARPASPRDLLLHRVGQLLTTWS